MGRLHLYIRHRSSTDSIWRLDVSSWFIYISSRYTTAIRTSFTHAPVKARHGAILTLLQRDHPTPIKK